MYRIHDVSLSVRGMTFDSVIACKSRLDSVVARHGMYYFTAYLHMACPSHGMFPTHLQRICMFDYFMACSVIISWQCSLITAPAGSREDAQNARRVRPWPSLLYSAPSDARRVRPWHQHWP